MAENEQLTEELRKMVHSFSAMLGRKCADAVRNSPLTDGRLEDRMEVGGVEWHIIVTYDGNDHVVTIKGHPHLEDSKFAPLGVQRMAEGIGVLFGQAGDKDSFEFMCPVSWLPEQP